MQVENWKEFQPNFKYLLFLPNYKDLESVNASIRSSCHLPEKCELRDLLRFLINSMGHDSVEVRALTLKKLKFVSSADQIS